MYAKPAFDSSGRSIGRLSIDMAPKGHEPVPWRKWYGSRAELFTSLRLAREVLLLLRYRIKCH